METVVGELVMGRSVADRVWERIVERAVVVERG
jgi:hypothetical protein